MDVSYLLGGLLLFIAPPVVSIIFRKIRKKPSLKNPVWQYVVTFLIMAALLLSGQHDYFGMIIILGIFIYVFCFYIDYLLYKQNKTNNQPAAKDELRDLDLNDADAVMLFAKTHPHLIDEINRLLELNKNLKIS